MSTGTERTGMAEGNAVCSPAGFAFFAQQRLDPRWVILVGQHYGAFLFAGTEADAEEMRCHKANQERAIAKKRPASFEDIEIPSQCWNHRGFLNRFRYADCRCGDCTDAW